MFRANISYGEFNRRRQDVSNAFQARTQQIVNQYQQQQYQQQQYQQQQGDYSYQACMNRARDQIQRAQCGIERGAAGIARELFK